MLRRLLAAAYAAYATVAFLAVVLPLCVVIILMPTLALRRWVGRMGMRLALLVCGIPFRIRGMDQLPTGPAIAVSNHASYLDGLVLTSALPSRYTFVVQDGAARWPLVGWTIRRMGVTFINRSEARSAAAQMRVLMRRLEAGDSLTIFPEGTFEKEPGLLAFKGGAFLMAQRARVPVVPVVITGTRAIWGEGRWPAWHPLTIEALPALPPPDTSRHASQALRQQARGLILARCGEPDAAPATPDEHADQN